MFGKLQSKWKVSRGRLFLIISTFALGGSLCGYAARSLMGIIRMDKGVMWAILYIIAVTLIWPVAVILVSIPLGQFVFFRNYLRKVFDRMRGSKRKLAENVPGEKATLNIAIFASGTGSNADKIIKTLPDLLHNGNETGARVVLIVTDNQKAGIINIAETYNLPAEIIYLKEKTEAQISALYLSVLEKHNIDFIIMAGYLKKIPAEVIRAYPRKIVNIHPALLPAYGGAGMYGKRVHEAVIKGCEKESGISVHYADEIYDNGEIIFQAKCNIEPDETTESLAKKIQALEHRHYPAVIADVLQSQNPR